MYGYSGANSKTVHFRYTPEAGWQLAGTLTSSVAEGEKRAVVVDLCEASDRRLQPTQRVSAICPRSWLRASLAPRGTGDTSWGESQHWHLRRAAALTGRTLASLRVLDVMQGLRAVRRQPGVDQERVYLAARGEMAVVALYAALLDGEVAGVVLENPPATQNVPDSEIGIGPLVEMLNCLRITDVAQVAGLLWPAALVFYGPRPQSYMWAEDVYRRLGAPGGWWNIPHNGTWRLSE